MNDHLAKRRRCAIYTRKSSEEGLEQDFNSLQAQREACESYIKSQQHEGWQRITAHYDDGGFSGGTLGRPALTRLIQDIQAKKVDVVVVYKVDRLTRALSDFAKLVDVFDTHSVSFVSVTQQFNTTSSMGRLTLNVLLSFAQFEREVTGERIRDKIAASKKKGMWMGGLVPLGYDVKDRQLIINEPEAETVRYIFRTYANLGSVSRLKEVLDARGIVSKIRKNRNPRLQGGKPMGRGMLYHLLRNRLYLGEIIHKGKPYPGQHKAIVEPIIWEQVQTTLDANRFHERLGKRAKSPSLLAGLLYDESGERMSPSHSVKKGKHYRYYVSQSLIRQPKRLADGGRRIPAADIEQLVSDQFNRFLADEGQVIDVIQSQVPDAPGQQHALRKAAQLAHHWPARTTPEQRAILLQLVQRIEIKPDRVDIRLSPVQLIDLLTEEEGKLLQGGQMGSQKEPLLLSVAARFKRSGMEMKLIVAGRKGNDGCNEPDPSLIKLIVKAHRLKIAFIHNHGNNIKTLASEHRINASYFTRLIRLTFLAPDITQSILEGRHPTELTAARLMRNTRFPLNWQDQRKKLGFTE